MKYYVEINLHGGKQCYDCPLLTFEQDCILQNDDFDTFAEQLVNCPLIEDITELVQVRTAETLEATDRIAEVLSEILTKVKTDRKTVEQIAHDLKTIRSELVSHKPTIATKD